MTSHVRPQEARPADPPSEAAGGRLDDMAQIIHAYNEVTLKLERSHEALNAEVQRLSRELASANAALQRSRRLAALGEMAAGIAHEIRNPLAAIQLDTQSLAADLAEHDDALLVQHISEAVRGLDAIVTDVLTFAREMEVRRVEAAAADVFENAVEALRPVIDEAGIRVRLEGDVDEVVVPHDRDLLHRALVNLIRNAAEAMNRGGTLTLGAEKDAQVVRLIVRDTGPGINADAIDRIFNPFFTTRPTGTGLGLAIVHRILDAHGGSIAVHNDGGAVFTLSLPVASGEPSSDDEESQPQESSPAVFRKSPVLHARDIPSAGDKSDGQGAGG